MTTAVRESERLAASVLKSLDYVIYMRRVSERPPVWPEEQRGA